MTFNRQRGDRRSLLKFFRRASSGRPPAHAEPLSDLIWLRPVFAGMESPEVWELAAERFARYAENRRKSGKQSPRRILADFLIGAQALTGSGVESSPILATFDARFFRRYFSELKVLNPTQH